MSKLMKIKPLGIAGSSLYYLIPAIILYVSHYYFVPFFMEATGEPYLIGYLIAWGSTMFLFFTASIGAFYLENRSLKTHNLLIRYRLDKMPVVDWLWVIIVLLIQGTIYIGLGFTTEFLAQFSLFAPHSVFPPEFGPAGRNAHIPGQLFGMDLAGQWWIIPVYFSGWILNILGEEFWFRGYLLPRQELSMGKFAWIANGLMFGMNHIWQPWNLLLILPGALIGAWIVQKRKNTWVLLIPHGTLNVTLLIIIALNVSGIKL